MDKKHTSQLFILKNCTSTASVQIDDPTSTSDYIGAGECVLTDAVGNVLADGDVDTAAELDAVGGMVIHQRNTHSATVYKSLPLTTKNVTGVSFKAYQAPVPLAIQLDAFNLYDSYEYIVKINAKNSNRFKGDTLSFTYKSKASGGTQDEIVDALVAAINGHPAIKDGTFPIIAVDAAADGIVIKEVISEVDPPRFIHSRFEFEVFCAEATKVDNTAVLMTWNGVNYGQMTYSFGAYSDIAKIEYVNKLDNKGYTQGLYSQAYPQKPLNLEAVSTETYDLLTITYKNEEAINFSNDVHTEGKIVIALPVTGNGTNQVSSLEPVFTDFIAAVGSSATISLT